MIADGSVQTPPAASPVHPAEVVAEVVRPAPVGEAIVPGHCVTPSPEPVRPRPLVEIACGGLFLAVAGAAAFPLVWGLALHQTPLAVSGGCAEVMCLLVALNRVFVPPAAKQRTVPLLAALEERPWVLAACLALMLTSAVTLITYWP